MKLPSRKRHWLKEIEKALDESQRRAMSEGASSDHLYRYAVPAVAKKRGIQSDTVLNEMAEYIEGHVGQDWDVDPESRKQYIFHFVSSYIFAHVPAGILREQEAEKIMLHVAEVGDIFIDA